MHCLFLACEDSFFLKQIPRFCVDVAQKVVSGRGERKGGVFFCVCAFVDGQKHATSNLSMEGFSLS